MSTIPPLGQAIIRTARNYKGFVASDDTNPEHNCHTCIRKQFSFPYTCNEGWKLMHKERGGAGCVNWSDSSRCRVDGLG